MPITLEFTKEALKDLLSLQAKLVTIENIQKTVADYYKVRMADLLSKRRSRSVARPRQVAMALAKELTSHSLPEIGDAFGGRDHTTVLHACKRIKELRDMRAAHEGRLFKPVENPGRMMWVTRGLLVDEVGDKVMHRPHTVSVSCCREVVAARESR